MSSEQTERPIMEDLVREQWDEVRAREMALRNAFGYWDDPTDLLESAEQWADAAAAASRLSEAADDLYQAARKIAREREDAVPDELWDAEVPR